MSQSCPVLTLAERQAGDILKRAEKAMLAAVYKAVEEARNQAAEELQSIEFNEEPPAYEYFAAIVHQKLFLLLCGADPETFEGGNPEIAANILQNAQNISDHYWTARRAGA